MESNDFLGIEDEYHWRSNSVYLGSKALLCTDFGWTSLKLCPFCSDNWTLLLLVYSIQFGVLQNWALWDKLGNFHTCGILSSNLDLLCHHCKQSQLKSMSWNSIDDFDFTYSLHPTLGIPLHIWYAYFPFEQNVSVVFGSSQIGLEK